jgi:hypothetical protein
VGMAAGVCVGIAAGACVGMAASACVGMAVGMAVGMTAGACVGMAVGMPAGVCVGMAAARRSRIFCLPPAKKPPTLKYAQACSSEDRASSGLLRMQKGQMALRVAQRTGEYLTG